MTGLAAAYAAQQLQTPITVYLPTTTPSFVLDNLKFLDATTVVVGDVWDETDVEARKQADNKCLFFCTFLICFFK